MKTVDTTTAVCVQLSRPSVESTMGLYVELTNETGEILDGISDDKNFLHRLLPTHDDASNPMLASIDWYGDTVFNSLQMRRFLPEWKLLSERALGTEELNFTEQVAKLATRCEEGAHLYLKFIGD